jgi:alkylation response protein AidB-like acyl-CoA dehydrogenase
MSERLNAFRAEVRAWLEAEAPASLRGAPAGFLQGTWGGRKVKFDSPDHERWLRMMAERGWTAPTWPTEYGGGGLSKAEDEVLKSELRRLKLPPPLIGFGLVMIGPTLLEFVTEAQKREHLPPIVRGEIRWCQGYSEPGSGSDLASLRTSAVRDGDRFVINGQKVWTSYAEKSDWIFCLVRTNTQVPKQQGITFILVDMDTPGVTTRPIPLISGASPFCEVFFSDVVAEARNVIGGIDQGWTVAKALLGHERTMVGEVFAQSVAGGEAELAQAARRYIGADADGKVADPLIRHELAQVAMDERAFMLTVKRIKDGAKAGQRPGPESSILKVYGTELNQRRRELSVRIAGTDGLGWEGEDYPPEALTATREWLRARGNTIEGGTSEIQLDIIAKHTLGLP